MQKLGGAKVGVGGRAGDNHTLMFLLPLCLKINKIFKKKKERKKRKSRELSVASGGRDEENEKPTTAGCEDGGGGRDLPPNLQLDSSSNQNDPTC